VVAALPQVRMHIDDRENMTPGAKYYEWETKGVPFRIEIGPKDLAKGQLALARRLVEEGQDRKQFLPEGEVISTLEARLEEFQQLLLERARERREANTHRGVATLEELAEIVEGDGGFVYSGWCRGAGCEERVKEE